MMEFATLEARDLAGTLRVVSFRGAEALCRPYRFDIYAQVEGEKTVDMAAAVASRATLSLARDGALPQVFHGILSDVRLLVQTKQWALYQLTLVPKLWQLGLTRHSRVFTKQSVPDIIREVLESAELTADDCELRLAGNYEEEELVVQYQESKLDFLHRWLEHEGLYYYFEQGDRAEKLVIVDRRSFHEPLVEKTVRYRPLLGSDRSARECFDSFAAHHHATVGAIKLADYDYVRPLLDVSAKTTANEQGFGEVSIADARFFDPEDAKRFAALRAEQIQASQVLHHAAGTALHMSAGYRTKLGEHPADGFNKEYLCTEVRHFGNQLAHAGAADALAHFVQPEFDDVYRVEVTAIDAETQYRPARTTPWPRIWGYEHGVIDGEKDSPYAQLDEHGRYLVRFRFDESELGDGKASTYVRMMQPHGGTTEGFHFPLRKGTEVLFTFLNGDPDRPVIAGVVPNAVTPSPVTAANHTRNVIQTGGENRIELEDEEGKQFIRISCPTENSFLHMGAPNQPYNVRLETGGSAAFVFEQSRHITVGSGGQLETIHGPLKEDYKSDHNTTVAGSRTEKVSGNVSETYGSLSADVKGAVVEKFNSGQVTGVTGSRTDTVSGAVNEAYGKLTVVVKGAYDTVVSGGTTHISPAGFKVIAPEFKSIDGTFDKVTGGSAEAVGSKNSFVGLYLGVAGIKLDLCGVKIETKGAYKRKAGVQLKSTGSSVLNDALRIVSAGLVSFK